MNTTELRSRIKTYIDHADERLLRIFNAIIEAEKNNSAGHVQDELISSPEHRRKPTEDEKGKEEGMGSLKDDHRLK